MAIIITSPLQTAHGFEIQNAYVKVAEAHNKKGTDVVSVAVHLYKDANYKESGIAPFQVQEIPVSMQVELLSPEHILQANIFQVAYEALKPALAVLLPNATFQDSL